MNCKVVYATMTGHSRKIAENVAERIEAVAYNVKNQDCEVMNEDLLIICAGIYSGKIRPELEAWLENLDGGQVRNALVIMSSVTHNYEQVRIKDILSEKGVTIVGEKDVQGSFLFMKFGRPNKNDINEAADYAEEIYNKLK